MSGKSIYILILLSFLIVLLIFIRLILKNGTINRYNMLDFILVILMIITVLVLLGMEFLGI